MLTLEREAVALKAAEVESLVQVGQVGTWQEHWGRDEWASVFVGTVTFAALVALVGAIRGQYSEALVDGLTWSELVETARWAELEIDRRWPIEVGA